MARIMIIDDSMMFREFLKGVLSNQPGFEIIGSFGNPVEAMEQIAVLKPDVIALDMEMPQMRGNEFLRAVLPANPSLKAVVISALSGNVFDAMQAGAIDFVAKPGFQPEYGREQFEAEVIQKIKIAAMALRRAPVMPPSPVAEAGAPRTWGPGMVTPKSLIAIGASTGGTEAIVAVVRDFPAMMPPVVIVQHMPPVFTKMYAERLNNICAMQVREAEDGDRAEPGTILIAPGGERQLRVINDGRGYVVSIKHGEKVSGHCPSVDVLFESVEKAAGSSAVGVILTGMGSDGAKGITEMRHAGAYTIGQDEASCVVYGMPKVAFDMGGITEQLPLESIGSTVQRRFGK